MEDLSDRKWESPSFDRLEGNYCILERLSMKHMDELYLASNRHDVTDIDKRYKYLPDTPPLDRDDFRIDLQIKITSKDPIFYAVIDKNTGKVGGRMSFMRIAAQCGVVEIGHIYWGPSIARTRIATESMYLLLNYAFNDLHYRRVEWKCDNKNEPSKDAAIRFGFTHEGLFRKHLIVKGVSRDTAWFSIIDDDWKMEKNIYETWLHNGNFDEDNNQQQSLSNIREYIHQYKIF